MAGEPPKREPLWKRIFPWATPEARQRRKEAREGKDRLRAQQAGLNRISALRPEIDSALRQRGLSGVQMRGAVEAVLKKMEQGAPQRMAIEDVVAERKTNT
ncbi:MAG: hypothetical protein HY394_00725 [Candidatus Diapherotrites archaeon]|nr:hypothetical protein [Candidatus Diapherotrites archaeon]